MTLDSSEKVYQADLMHVTPMADAQIYGYGGDWILAGMETEITATGVEIQPGRAVIQGHLYTLNSTKSITLQAGVSGYIGWSIDLTQDNSAVGADVTNNQYTFGFFTEPPAGDTLNGDTQATVAFAKVTASGSSWNVTTNIYQYSRRVEYNTPPSGSQVNNEGFYILCERVGKYIHYHISIAGGLPAFDGTPINILPAGLNPDLIPNHTVWGHGEMSGASIASRISLYGMDAGEGEPGRLALNKGFNTSGLFTSSHTYTNGNLWADLYGLM